MLKKFKIPKSIIYLLGLAIFLNILRVILFGNISFLYILWNIFLAFIPFFISSILSLNTSKDNIFKLFFVIGFILWFIFLPNAPYVVTDFIHLGRFRVVPPMYDMFLLFTSAWVSLLMGLHSITQMEKMLLLKFRSRVVHFIMIVIILFASFGVYLGRYLRFNSWDLFISHNSLITSTWETLTLSNNYANVYGYTLLFFVFLYISYLSFRE